MKLGPEYNLPFGTKVRANFTEMPFEGVIVGKASTDLTQSHIVRCTDETLPNEAYPYDTCVVTISLIDLI